MLIPAPATASPQRPSLSAARVPLTRAVEVLDESGARRTLHIPAERPLTLYLDKRELVTLMTLGAAPELLTLGYLRNQRLVERVEDIESVVVDWEVGAAAVTTRSGTADAAARTRQRIVTTGCGQGTMFGMLMEELEARRLAPPAVARIRQSTLMQLSEIMRTQDSIHRRAGSVHGCALFRGLEMLMFVEDVGRHNAIDTIAGWMWLHGDSALGAGDDKLFYTTGRLTSEMVTKAAQLGVPIVISRNGVTQMGYELAQRLGMALFGRANLHRFICYCGFERFDSEPQAEPAPVRVSFGG
ncbi:MAG: formate dehydrogenase accessory sulfurtransferase FdhD [Burkholderiales bacterium]|jgi:FdhD protein|nr:formate dehydrogenase accessory sulfurtransferase FdhD [Burkholderiales bacterium]